MNLIRLWVETLHFSAPTQRNLITGILTRAKTKRSGDGFLNKFSEEGKQAVTVDHVLKRENLWHLIGIICTLVLLRFKMSAT